MKKRKSSKKSDHAYRSPAKNRGITGNGKMQSGGGSSGRSKSRKGY